MHIHKMKYYKGNNWCSVWHMSQMEMMVCICVNPVLLLCSLVLFCRNNFFLYLNLTHTIAEEISIIFPPINIWSMHPYLFSGPTVLSYLLTSDPSDWLLGHTKIVSKMMSLPPFQSSSFLCLLLLERLFQSQMWSCVKVITSSTLLYGKNQIP